MYELKFLLQNTFPSPRFLCYNTNTTSFRMSAIGNALKETPAGPFFLLASSYGAGLQKGFCMSGKGGTNRVWSSTSLLEVFRFSPRPNQAHKIRWRAWGRAAFQEATRLDKPIFLLISSSWCQWCHIMDETTLSEPSIISILNHDYIPIRVDSDLRPDVNQRYNQNGWPSVVLLTPEGEILWGGVYVPPKQMLYYLGHIRRYYSEHRYEISEQVRELQDRRFTQKLTQALPSTGLRTL